ncbi:tRNA (guanosine(37)-N1)-methyltransferase TrmD [Candidatus Gracilibacteria bacterium]|nr:tRNA (guanosine(37)-N1)-methyltransferase TrmD [Candidatus Gracilibacteria bacterium]
MIFDVLTIFPGLIEGYLSDSILKREIAKKTMKVRTHDIRAYSKDKHKKVDARPYGGGAGMLMTPEPLYDAITAAKKKNPKAPVIYMSPTGKMFTYKMAKKLAKKPGLILVCGRYEGIDERVKKLCIDEEISIGEYVLSGGELPSLVVIEAVTRLLPGALGDERSAHEDSFTEALDGKKEYPHYTRPPVFKGLKVPKVLLGGHHAKINEWRKKKLK